MWKKTSFNFDLFWDSFLDKFNFSPSIYNQDWPSIEEPAPFITWSIFSYKKENTYTEINILSEEFINTILIAASKESRIFGFEHQHEVYEFNANGIYNENTRWPFFFVPINDYNIIISEDLSFGFFCHPWESSICAFGERLFKYFDFSKIPCKGKIIRTSGITI